MPSVGIHSYSVCVYARCIAAVLLCISVIKASLAQHNRNTHTFRGYVHYPIKLDLIRRRARLLLLCTVELSHSYSVFQRFRRSRETLHYYYMFVPLRKSTIFCNLQSLEFFWIKLFLKEVYSNVG